MDQAIDFVEHSGVNNMDVLYRDRLNELVELDFRMKELTKVLLDLQIQIDELEQTIFKGE